MLKQARELVRSGAFAEACPLFDECQRRAPDAETLDELFECYWRLVRGHLRSGRTASAWSSYRLLEARAQEYGEPELEMKAAAEAAVLARRLSRLTVIVPQAWRSKGVRLTRNGIEMSPRTWNIAWPVDPGRHTITAEAPGEPPWAAEVDVGANGSNVQVVALGPAPKPSTAIPAVGSSVTPSTQGDSPVLDDSTPAWGTQKTIGAILGGVGIAEAAVGGALMLLGEIAHEDSEDDCPASSSTCSNGPGLEQSAYANSCTAAGKVLLSNGGLLAAVGVGLFLLAPADEDGARNPTSKSIALVPVIAPSGASGFLLQSNF